METQEMTDWYSWISVDSIMSSVPFVPQTATRQSMAQCGKTWTTTPSKETYERNISIRNWIERSWRSLSDIYLQLITSIWYHLIYTAMHLAIWQQPSSSCTLEHLSSHIKRMGPIPNSAMTPLDTLTPHRRRSSQHVCCWEGGHVQLASLPSTLSLLTTISSIPRSTSWCSFERAYENARCNVWVKTYYTCISGVLHIHK